MMLARDSSSGSAKRSWPAKGHLCPRPAGGRPPSLTGWPRSPIGGIQVQGTRVDAVALPRGTRPVVEDVTQVTATPAAHHLGPAHPQAVVRAQLDVLGHGWLVEAGPACSRVEFRLRVEQLGAAARAPVHAVLLDVPIGTGEGSLG